MNKNNISTYIYSIVFCLLAACIIMHPGEAFASAYDGLRLWLNVVCPALLPFFICVDILIGLGIVSFFGSAFKSLMRPLFNVPGEGSFGFFMSISSGYPVGARITARLCQEKLCTNIEGQRLLSLCSTSGPLFIIGAVATGILNNPALGFFLAVSHYFSAITIGFLMRHYGREAPARKAVTRGNPLADMLDYRKKDGRPIGLLMGDAVKSGVNLILMIGGFIILFSVITGMLKISGFLDLSSALVSKVLPAGAATPDIISSLITGFMEVTNGARACAALQIPMLYKAILVSFMIGFGGLSVNAQVMSIISDTELKFSIYLLFKLLQGIIAAIYTFVLLTCFSDMPVFNIHEMTGANVLDAAAYPGWINIFTSALFNMLIILLFMTAAAVIKKRKGIFKKSLF